MSQGITDIAASATELIQAYYAELERVPTPWWSAKPAEYIAGQAILAAKPATQAAIVREALSHPAGKWKAANTLLSQLCRRSLPFAAVDTQAIIQTLAASKNQYDLPAQALLRALKGSLANLDVLAACRADLERLRATATTWYFSADQRKFLKVLDDLLGGKAEIPIYADEWGSQVMALLDTLGAATRDHWLALLRHCATATSAAPSAKWAATAFELRAALGVPEFTRLAAEWFGAFRRSGNKPPTYQRESPDPIDRGCLVVEENANLIRGLAWCCADRDDAALAAVLADAVIAGYRKISGVGPRSAKVAGACVLALKSMPGLHGAAQLERARLNVKQPNHLKLIERSLDEAAQRAGITRADLEELTVPTFGLDRDRLDVAIGDAAARIEVVGSDARLQWLDAAGKPRKAEPVTIKRDHKAELKDLKRLRDDIAHMLAAQRDRLERLPLAERTWTLADWRARYLDHPLVSGLARRLIWRFAAAAGEGHAEGDRAVDGAWLDGALVDSNDRPLDLPATATVSPWHPALRDASAVLAWREWLERHRVTQPFKQAHREVYLLTDAERTTRVYSNRFAAHILRQHQFNALAAARGWRNKLRLMVDDAYPPASLTLPRWNLRAEFWIEGTGDNYGVDTNETGTYLYVATDQVRFYASDADENYAHAGGGGYAQGYSWRARQQHAHDYNEPVPLERIPPLVLSEVLRDVDLFVGVASVGNDPTWQDGGHQGRYRDYWQSYSFGDLSATAETRKQLLERLIPRLAIADRCAVEGRFLIVRGDLRMYKIHLGSGNILMEPNDQYLCIVRSRGTADTATGALFLPFEGDSVLSIILSKAFLLADDARITDPTITRQIGQA